MLVDPVEALLARDLLRRREDAVVVAGARRPRLGCAGGERVEVDVEEELVDRPSVQRQRLLLVEPGCGPARRCGRRRWRRSSAPSAASEAGGHRQARAVAEQRARDGGLDGVGPAVRVRGDGARRAARSTLAGARGRRTSPSSRSAAARRPPPPCAGRVPKPTSRSSPVAPSVSASTRTPVDAASVSVVVRASSHTDVGRRRDPGLEEVGGVGALEVAVVLAAGQRLDLGSADGAHQVLLDDLLEPVGLGHVLLERAEQGEALGVVAAVGAVGVEEVVLVDDLAGRAHDGAAEAGAGAGPVEDLAVDDLRRRRDRVGRRGAWTVPRATGSLRSGTPGSGMTPSSRSRSRRPAAHGRRARRRRPRLAPSQPQLTYSSPTGQIPRGGELARGCGSGGRSWLSACGRRPPGGAPALADAPVEPAGEWLAGDLHVHTPYSHDSYGGPTDDNTGLDEAYTAGLTVQQQFTLAASRGLDFLAITDHNDIRSQSDPGFGAGGRHRCGGYENSLDGHAQMLGADRVYDNGVGTSDRAARPAAGRRRRLPDQPPPRGRRGGLGARPRGRARHRRGLEHLAAVPAAAARRRPTTTPPSPSGRASSTPATTSPPPAGPTATGRRRSPSRASAARRRGSSPPSRSEAGVLDGIRRGPHVDLGPAAGAGRRPRVPRGRRRRRRHLRGDGRRHRAGRRRCCGPGSRARPAPSCGSSRTAAQLAFPPVPVTSAAFEHRFRVADGTWVRAEVARPDLAEQRRAVCGDATTYCRNLLLVEAMTSALYQSRRRDGRRRRRGRHGDAGQRARRAHVVAGAVPHRAARRPAHRPRVERGVDRLPAACSTASRSRSDTLTARAADGRVDRRRRRAAHLRPRHRRRGSSSCGPTSPASAAARSCRCRRCCRATRSTRPPSARPPRRPTRSAAGADWRSDEGWAPPLAVGDANTGDWRRTVAGEPGEAVGGAGAVAVGAATATAAGCSW